MGSKCKHRSVVGSPKGWANIRRKRGVPRPKWTCYEIRDSNAQAIGYTTYSEYLTSPEWAIIRSEVLKMHPKCIGCSKPSCQVHHLDYSVLTLLGRQPHFLIGVCDACHGLIEFDGKRKRTLEQANQELCRLAIKNGQTQWFLKFKSYKRKPQNAPPKSMGIAGKESRKKNLQSGEYYRRKSLAANGNLKK